MDAGQVLVTGACGFLGNLLATHLAPHHRHNLILLDHAPPPPNPVPGAHYVRPPLSHLSIAAEFRDCVNGCMMENMGGGLYR
jgi:nucleoside-diphosphate-sugar epimerase